MKNYALITKGIEDLLVESYKNNDKKTINNMLTELKSNPKLKTLYAVVDNLKNGVVPPNKIVAFINENIKIAKSIDFSEFDKLISNSKEDDDSELLHNIGILLFQEKTVVNMSEHYTASDFVKNHLIETNTWEDKYSDKLAEYSKKYITMDDDDKKLFEQFLTTKSGDRKELFETLVSDCVNVLSEEIEKASDVNLKLKLYETKDKISSMGYNKETYAEKMVKIHQLKKELL